MGSAILGAMALFRIDQATPGAGTAGLSRHDLVPGEIITLTATSPVGAGITYAWEILDKVNSTAVLSGTTGSSVTIGNAGLINQPCAFLIRLTVNNNGTITTEERIASVRSLKGLRIPLFPETAPASNTLTSNDPSLSTDNANYANRGGVSAGQNWRGWAEWTYEVVMVLESLSASPTGTYTVPGSVSVGDVIYVTGSNTADRASNAAVATARGAVGIVVQKPTGTTAVAILAGEVGTLSGLTAGVAYFLGTNGALVAVPPTSAGSVVRRIGVAKNATTLSLTIGEPWTVQAGSPPMKYDVTTRVLAQFEPGDTLNLTVSGAGTGIISIRALSSNTATPGAELVGVDLQNLTVSLPAASDLQSVLEAIDTAIGASGGGSLQDAYNLGRIITESASGGVLISQGSGSPLNNYVMRLVADIGSASVAPLQIVRAPLTSAGGAGVAISMGANAFAPAIDISSLGSGAGVYVASNGSGTGIVIDNSGGSGDGISILVAAGEAAIQSQIGGQNAFTVDGTAMAADFGSSSAPIIITGHSTARMGSAAGATAKTFELFTTDAGTVPSNTNKLARIIGREGVRTAGANVAELAVLAGSAGEIPITKAGYLYAQRGIFEMPIENGVTIAFGQAVGVSNVAGRCSLANAGAANEYLQMGICLVGGTGDAGGSVYALIVQSGAVSGLSGFTHQRPVYLDPTTPGGLTTTKPTSGVLVIAGFSTSTTSMHVQFALAPPDAAGSTWFTFAPGATPSGNIYASFAALYAAASAVPNPTIEIDTNGGPAQIPSGTYDWDGWTWRSIGTGSRQTLTFLDGAQWSPAGTGSMKFENLTVESDGTGLSASVVILDACSLFSLTLENASIKGDEPNEIGFFSANPAAFSQSSVAVMMSGESALDEFAFALDTTTNAGNTVNVAVVGYGRAIIDPKGLAGSCDQLTYDQRSSYSNFAIQTELTPDTVVYSMNGGERKDIFVNATCVGDTAILMGALRLPAGAVIAEGRALLGTTNGAHTAHIDLVRRTGATVVGHWEVSGFVAEAVLDTADNRVVIADTDWYEFQLRADDAGQTALCHGIHLVVYSASVPQ